jgi:hypothetical protein
MGRVRRFTRYDVPRVTRLHQTVFPQNGERRSEDDYSAYFNNVYLENPAGVERFPSLVYEDDAGQIAGFLGVVHRRVVLDDCRYEAAVSSQFIVDPQASVALVAVKLARAFLEGPQDLSIADEATDAARAVWERLGGSTALLHSLYWTRPLRPARLGLSFARERKPLAPFAIALTPFASAIDALVTYIPGSHFRQPEPSAQAEELSAHTALAYAPELYRGTLWVEYDEPTFQWLLDRATARGGHVLKHAFRNGLDVVGWYICHLDEAGHAEVAHLAATPASIKDVLDHLFYHAWRHGATSVSGRVDPRFMQALSDHYCVLHRRGPWVLIKTTKPELLSAFQTGKASISPLDGEWSLRFFAPPATRRTS